MTKNIKKPSNPKIIRKGKYFKVGIRDSQRVKLIKEAMNHMFDERNNQLEEAFYQEAVQYTEEILGTTRRMNITKDDDEEIMNKIFSRTEEVENEQEGAELSVEEVISGEEEERREREAEEPEEESETLSSEEVLALQERIQAEDQEEYERIRAELEEDEANNDN